MTMGLSRSRYVFLALGLTACAPIEGGDGASDDPSDEYSAAGGAGGSEGSDDIGTTADDGEDDGAPIGESGAPKGVKIHPGETRTPRG